MESSRLIKPIKATTKPLLLKDHLLDDMSSCSSNGFKSFPRRQCCTTVRFLHEFDRKSKQRQINLKKPPSKSALSALITAVRRLPFVAAKTSEKKKSNFNSFLPRSFSKKIFMKGSFWKRKPEQKWKSFDQLLKEEPQPSDCSITTTDDRKSYRWSDGGNSSSAEEVKNDVFVVVEPVEEVSDGGVGVSNDDVSLESTTTTSSDGSSDTNSSSTETKKQWSSHQEKEQFSPVSVLDCPFDDDDEVSSPFQHRLARMEGTRKKLLKKIQKFECLAKLEPVNLTNRFSSEPDSDNESSTSLDEEEEEQEEEEEEAMKLLDQMKLSMSSHGINLKPERLLLDFFRERIASDQQHCTSVDKQRGVSSFHDALVEIAEDWIHEAKPREMFMEWEVEKNRQAYVEDMEKCGEWKRIDQENEEVGLELGNEVFDSLLNEVLLDITS